MMWGCMMWKGPGYACRIDGRMDADLYTQILDDDLVHSLEFWEKEPAEIIFQRLLGGFLTMVTRSSHGQHSLLTSTLLNIFGVISKNSFQPLKNLLMEYRSFGKG
jgi:hypothetical protein